MDLANLKLFDIRRTTVVAALCLSPFGYFCIRNFDGTMQAAEGT
jgi:hypothetical protein